MPHIITSSECVEAPGFSHVVLHYGEYQIENTYAPEADTLLAHYDTLLGQLQRGRGLGFLRTMQADPSEAHACLYKCVTDDPRVDRQVETRADYYAQLIERTRMSLAPLAEYLRTVQHDRLGWEVAQTIETLGQLALLGDKAAALMLKEYIAYGAQWDVALQVLAELGDPDLLEGIPEIICGRFRTGEELEESATYGLYSEPTERALWEQWSLTHPCIARLLAEVAEIEASYKIAHPRPLRQDYEKLSIAELLAISTPQNFYRRAKKVEETAVPEDEATMIAVFSTSNSFARYAALLALQKIDSHKYTYLYHEILEQAVARLASLPEESGPHITEVRAIRHTLVLLPPDLTLPLARQWLSAGSWNKESVAEDILEQHATRDDIPMVAAALAHHLQEETENVNSYHTCSLLDILALFPDIGLLPQVEQVFMQTGYSPARKRAASAMRINAPQWFTETYAYECMWDCDQKIRQIGCASVSLEHLGARQRLQELAEDLSASDLSHVAQARLDET